MKSLISSTVVAAVIGGILGEVVGVIIFGVNGGVAIAGPSTLFGILVWTNTSAPIRVA